MLCLPGLLEPEPLSPQQDTAGPCLRASAGDTQTTKAGLTQSLWDLWVLVHMRFYLSLPNISGRHRV